MRQVQWQDGILVCYEWVHIPVLYYAFDVKGGGGHRLDLVEKGRRGCMLR